jgi:hypothetical protein
MRSCLLPKEISCRKAILFFLSYIFFSAPGLPGQTPEPTEYQVKAAYLYNFGKFVQWPTRAAESEGDPFGICVLGENPFGTAFEALAGQTINGHKVVTWQISKAQDAEKCSVLFIGVSEKERISIILAALKKFPILTVSDMPHFVTQGGMIQFVMRNNKIRFEVNRTAAEGAGLNLSSELLKVAVNVKKNH